MALTKASDILGLDKKVKEIAVPIDSLSASKVTVDLPDFTATNAADAFEELKAGSSEIKLTPLKIASPSVTIAYYNFANVTSDLTLAANEEIIGYAAKYNGDDNFIVCNCSKNASNKVVLRLYNPTGYDHTSSTDIVGVVLSRIVETKKKTTKKRG